MYHKGVIMKLYNLHLFLFYTQIISLVLLVLLFINQHTCLLCKLSTKHASPNKTNQKQCGKHTCGAIDDVNNPAYNMQNVVKQSILLEEHLAEKNKYCEGCLVKHFSHICALSSEGVWLAEKNINKYPFLEESPSFYQKIFDKWLANRYDDAIRLEILSLLRERRRQLIDVYFLESFH